MDRKERLKYLSMADTVGLNMVDEFAATDTEEMVQTINDKYPKHSITMFPDATGDSNSSNASMSDIAMLKQGGLMVKANGTNPRIVDRINSVQRLLHNDLLNVNTLTCPRSSEAMEEHAYNIITNLPEKINKPGSIDDRNDAVGYPCAFMFPIKKLLTTVHNI